MTIDEYLKERNEGHQRRFPLCRPLPGVMKLITHLKAHNIPIAVATSSHRKAFILKSSQNQDLFSLFDHIVCGDDPAIKNGKPSPDLFIEAASRLGVADPEMYCKCLVFEDAPSGVLAGLNANMHVAWIHDTNLTLDEELKRRAALVAHSMELFDPVLFGLPPYLS